MQPGEGFFFFLRLSDEKVKTNKKSSFLSAKSVGVRGASLILDFLWEAGGGKLQTACFSVHCGKRWSASEGGSSSVFMMTWMTKGPRCFSTVIQTLNAREPMVYQLYTIPGGKKKTLRYALNDNNRRVRQ